MMRKCDRCLENRWTFKRVEEIVRATCEGCGNQVFFTAKHQKSPPIIRKITKEGQRCRHCNTPVEKKTHATPPREKPGGYWFEWWFKCPNPSCCTLYMVKEAERQFAPKVLIDRRPDIMPQIKEMDAKPPWD